MNKSLAKRSSTHLTLAAGALALLGEFTAEPIPWWGYALLAAVVIGFSLWRNPSAKPDAPTAALHELHRPGHAFVVRTLDESGVEDVFWYEIGKDGKPTRITEFGHV